MKLIKRSLTVLICIFCVNMWTGAQTAFSAMSNYDLEHKINELNERLEKAEKTGVPGKLGEWLDCVTLSGAIELDYSYTDPRDVENKNSDSTSDLNIGAAELGLEVCFHEYVTGNFILKGENLDDDDRVFWDEATITIQKEGFPLYFVGGKRGQPFGVFESHLISDTITQDCYEIAKTGATIGFVPGILGLDISATVYRGDTLIEHLDEAEVGADVVVPDNDDVSSFIANVTVEPAEGLFLSAYWDSEPGNDERNETLGGTAHYEFWKVALDAEYIGAKKREKIAGEEHKESAWFAAAAFQVTDPLEIAVRYGAFNYDLDGDQDGHLENRYSVGVSYILFEKNDFATTLMLEYRKSNYENETGVTVEDAVNEVFAKLAIEF
ncbi:MAG: LbtU family siderophore porin [Syntrophobacterales bacterium]|nr:LbtU family siderophore porin [Syntrophobacterales bacterium]